MRFDFVAPSVIRFGPGRLSEAAELAKRFGTAAFVVTGSHPERAAFLIEALKGAGLSVRLQATAGEPTVREVRSAAEAARGAGCDVVVALGGGSVLDTGKAVSALLTNPGDVLDYVEVIGAGNSIARAAAPFVAVPTTAGTGTEATSNAVIASPEHRVKVSLRSAWMVPAAAVVDPLLTVTCPADVTAASGLDALTQLLEPFTCSSPNPLADALCRDGFARIRRSLKRAVEQGSDAAAREDMALAALESGMALANAKLGAVHGMAAPLGGMFPAPHGAACARLLPEVMEANIRLLRSGDPEGPGLQRYTEAARILTGNVSAFAETGVEWVRGLVEAFRIRPLSDYGVRPEHFPALARRAVRASSMKGNPVPLGEEDVTEILSRSV